ncbi:MAG: alanine--glyoxylate aminotransferase family protein [Candidatus Hydrogenedentes bacterium]|nr:alanine--glyoxylate aminotransferase family protein [Candidatus Hydrogenedentota bacterium]
MSITSFTPPIRTLMGPGPSDIHPRVLAALSRPTLGHLDPEFIRMMDEMKQLLQYAFMTKNAMTIPISAPGSAGMECCFANLVEHGDKVMVCNNGVFGTRMLENVERCGGVPVVVEDAWGSPVELQKVEDALKAHPDTRIVAFVHAETATGARSDAQGIAALAKQRGALVIADTVTSLGGVALRVDEWGLDAVYSGSQKCLSCTPGLSPVTFGPAAVEKIKGRAKKVQSWFLDQTLVMGYWGSGQAKRAYHHTAPINALYGLHEALVMLQEEGLEAAWARHARNHGALKAGLEAMGLELPVALEARLPQLNVVRIPEGIEDAPVRTALLNEYSLEIGAGLGAGAGKVWRIGLMGHASQKKNVVLCLTALESVLGRMGASINPGVAVKAALQVYES